MKSFSELTSASQVNNGDLLAISQTSGSGYASKKTTVKDITDKSNLNLAEEYDSTSTYAVDDYVIYESVLYKCIASTTGTFDSTKWTSVVVTDEMGSGGGGGTGGHTIIDKNGNSMTARAGLQFVGGANVSDDGTNNKTIVDVASAGGIDGVFIDTENVIYSTSRSNTTDEYTATEDCFVMADVVTASNQVATVKIDDVLVCEYFYSNVGTGIESYNGYLKKGQTIKVEHGQSQTHTFKVLGIQTGTTHSKFQPVIYSLEERVVGVWKDGRPLYEKTVDFGALPNNTTKTVSYNISDLDYFVKIQGIAHNQNGTRNIPFVDDTYKTGDVLLDTIKSGGVIRIIAHTDLSSLTGDVTLQYVKTSDTAGSGTWTPQGVPTHHYSTDEQVIGTWIDGKTLYEKTIFEQPTYQNNTATIPIGAINVHNLSGGVETSTGEDNIAFGYTNISPAEYVRAYQSGTNLSVYNSFSSNRPYVCATIQYTKTS